MSRRVLWIALPVIAAVAWLDHVTAPDVRLYVLYLVPVVAVAWWAPDRDGIVVAVVAMIFATAADAPWRTAIGLPVLVWNATSRLILFTFTAAIVGQLRTYRDKLAALDRDHKRAYGREAMLARTDALTGLPNLRAFLEIIQRELARAVREGSHLCVLFVDLDDFKSVNDRYGHQSGDVVLQEVARALQSSVRGGDVVARIGGDEFIILLWHTTPADATIVGERIQKRIREVATSYPLTKLDASVGLRYFEQPPANADDVVRLADAAMYDVKEKRKAERAAAE